MGQCYGCSKGQTGRIVILGLDAAGKTTLLYQLKLHTSIYTTPTVGFNVEDIELRNGRNFTAWDIGGQDRLRRLWKYYLKGSKGLMFVLDSTDSERLDEAKQELKSILGKEDMRALPFVILANKQDMPGALSPTMIRQRLSLEGITEHKWNIYPVSAKTADGLAEAIHALSDLVEVETKL